MVANGSPASFALGSPIPLPCWALALCFALVRLHRCLVSPLPVSQAALLNSQVSTSPPLAPSDLEHVKAEPPRLNALLLTYLLDGSFDRKSFVDDWELHVRDRLVGAPGTPGGTRSTTKPAAPAEWPDLLLSVRSDAILGDDITSATSNVVLLITAGIAAMSIYVAMFLSRDTSLVGSRAPLGGMAMLSIALATISAFGVVAFIGVPYNEMVNVALFVMLGVGVDDAFIVVRAFEDRLDEVVSVRTSSKAFQALLPRGLSNKMPSARPEPKRGPLPNHHFLIDPSAQSDSPPPDDVSQARVAREAAVYSSASPGAARLQAPPLRTNRSIGTQRTSRSSAISESERLSVASATPASPSCFRSSSAAPSRVVAGSPRSEGAKPALSRSGLSTPQSARVRRSLLVDLGATGLQAQLEARKRAAEEVAGDPVIGAWDARREIEMLAREAREIEEALGKAMASAGPSILLSSSTNAIAFYVSAMSPLPALVGFCTHRHARRASTVPYLCIVFQCGQLIVPRTL